MDEKINSYIFKINEILKNKSGIVKEAEKKRFIIMIEIILVLIISFIIILSFIEDSKKYSAIIFFIVINIINYIFVNKKIKEVQEIIESKFSNEIVEMIYGKCNYFKNVKVNIESFYKSKLYKEREKINYRGENFIEYENAYIKSFLSNITAIYGSGKNSRLIFEGIFFVNNIKNINNKEEIIIKDRNRIDEMIYYFIFIIIILTFIILYFMEKEIISNYFVIIMALPYFLAFCYMMYKTIWKLKGRIKVNKKFDKIFITKGDDLLVKKILNKEITEGLIKIKKSGVEVEMSLVGEELFLAISDKNSIFQINIFGKIYKKIIKNSLLYRKYNELNKLICNEVLKQLKKENKI